MTNTIRWVGLTTAATSMITGGTFFAFSTFVLPALRALPAGTAAAAMQAINVKAPRSLLMVPLLGAAAGGVVLIVLVLVRDDVPHRALLLTGGAAAIATLAITAGYHVPRNDAFGRLDPHAAARAWASYASGWAVWNHVRTVTALVSGALLVAGLWPRAA